MPVLNINLLQKEQRQVSRLSQATAIVGVAAGSIVVLMLLIGVFLYTTVAIRSGQKDGLIQEQKEFTSQADALEEFPQPFYPEMSLAEQAKAYQQQVDGTKTLIDNHKYFTLYLSEIAVNTPTTVVYQSFSSDSLDRLTVTGKADSYGALSKLAKKFEGLSFAKSVSIEDARLDTQQIGKGKAVQFTLVIELKSAAELQKLPGPSGPSGSGVDIAPIPSQSPGAGSSTASPAPESANIPFGDFNE